MKSASKNIVRILIATCAAFMAFTAISAADTAERDTYKATVEPICKTNSDASDKYLKGVKDLVKKDKLALAGQNFSKAASALEKAQKQLAAVQQPPEDAAKLTKWISGIKEEVALMRTISKAFKDGNKGKGSSLSVKLSHNATKTNAIPPIAYQFKYCKIDPSKYS